MKTPAHQLSRRARFQRLCKLLCQKRGRTHIKCIFDIFRQPVRVFTQPRLIADLGASAASTLPHIILSPRTAQSRHLRQPHWIASLILLSQIGRPAFNHPSRHCSEQSGTLNMGSFVCSLMSRSGRSSFSSATAALADSRSPF